MLVVRYAPEGYFCVEAHRVKVLEQKRKQIRIHIAKDPHGQLPNYHKKSQKWTSLLVTIAQDPAKIAKTYSTYRHQKAPSVNFQHVFSSLIYPQPKHHQSGDN